MTKASASIAVLLLVFLFAPTYADLTAEDLLEIQKIVKEESRATEQRLKEYVDIKFTALQGEMNARFDALSREMNARFDVLGGQISFIQWLLGIFFGGGVVGFLIWLWQYLKGIELTS
ncbi:MAG: hypothetical protein ACUVXI_16925 [bacterium]